MKRRTLNSRGATSAEFGLLTSLIAFAFIAVAPNLSSGVGSTIEQASYALGASGGHEYASFSLEGGEGNTTTPGMTGLHGGGTQSAVIDGESHEPENGAQNGGSSDGNRPGGQH